MGYFKYLIPVILAMVFWYVFFAIITISTANANTPDWVLGKGHKSFPEIKYLVGVGVSEKSPIMASQSARTELIKTISVRINSVVTDYNSREKSISKSSIVTETDFLLEGSQVKDGWYDNRNDLYYSFVVIERDHVLETLKTEIDNIFLNIELMLKQGNDSLNNSDIITALVHYYDGYKETDKVLPYIMTYNSVIMVKNGQKYRGWYDYKILFKEKIQDIVNNISLDKVSETVDQTNIYLNARALYKGKGIKDFPIKFSNGYNHYNKRVLCNRVGECEIKPRLIKVAHVDTVDIFVNAVVDLQTFEKHFNYSLQKKLFGRLELLSVSFQVRKEIIAPVVKTRAVKFDFDTDSNGSWSYDGNKYKGNKYPLSRAVNEALAEHNRPQVVQPKVVQPKVVQPRKDTRSAWQKCCANEIGPNLNSNYGRGRSRGNVWLNFNFGNGRSRGNINMNRRW